MMELLIGIVTFVFIALIGSEINDWYRKNETLSVFFFVILLVITCYLLGLGVVEFFEVNV
ncbi:hypothetical protein AB4J90_16410 [Geobacillus thermodenitrificans]|uniref:hypothetical protein n=2 Tax=Geobacillus thermodenitrificans TaxID=33940 RepID=UPI0024C9065A|nr:hypothetical protein [Geobacillus thermodenitrificans]UYL94129.1 hypothetical protein PK51_gp51 [Geobacillus phage vB_GthS_PK5.1]